MVHFMMAIKETLVFLFVLGLILFNWPFLGIFEHTQPLYLFLAWGAFVFALMAVLTLGRKKEKE